MKVTAPIRLVLLLAVALAVAGPSLAVTFGALQTLQSGIGFTTVLTLGPEDPDPASAADGCIYAVNGGQGAVHRICFDANKAVTSSAVVLDINGAGGVNNTLGITFQPSSNPAGTMVLYLAYSDTNNDPFNGKIGRAVSTNGGSIWAFDDGFGGDGEDFITGLARSSFDHQTNGLDFGPDDCLYVAQGNNSNAGYDPTHAASRLSGAILRACFLGGGGEVLPGVDLDCGNGNTQQACDVEVYASGMRNPFDLAWHSNGELYATDNDANSGFRDDCASNANTFGCPCQEVDVDPNDELNRVVQGLYYGSPNPYLANPTGLQCQGGSDAGRFCTLDVDCSGGTCEDLSSLCTDAVCGNDALGAADPANIQCYYVTATQNPLVANPGLDPDDRYEPPLFNNSLLDGIVEYRAPLDWDSLALGAFCSDWNGDLIMTPAGGNQFKRARPSLDGLSATFEGTGNLTGLRGLDVVVGPDGTIYAASLNGGSVEYQVPVSQPNAGQSNFFLACSPGNTCDAETQACVPLPLAPPVPTLFLFARGVLLVGIAIAALRAMAMRRSGGIANRDPKRRSSNPC